jgi:hypothetical protein
VVVIKNGLRKVTFKNPLFNHMDVVEPGMSSIFQVLRIVRFMPGSVIIKYKTKLTITRNKRTVSKFAVTHLSDNLNG